MATITQSAVPRWSVAKLVMTRWARTTYTISAGLFVTGIVLQVFTAGMGVLVHPRYFGLHIAFGHAVQWLTVVLLVTSVIGRFPRRFQWLNVLLLGLFALQYLFLGTFAAWGIPAVRALHAVNALALFWLAVHLTRSAWSVHVKKHK